MIPTADAVAQQRRWVGAAVWSAIVAVALVWGTLWVKDAGVSLRAAPLMGHWDWHPGLRLLTAGGLAGATVLWGPAVARQLRWWALPPLVGVWGVAWAVALASADGWSRLTSPLTTRHEYEPLAAQVDDLGDFLTTYVDRLGDYPIHVQGHPPGPVVLAWVLDQVGLGGAGWLAALALGSWAGALALALVASRDVAGEAAARRAAPALAVLPAAVWAATSMDALFAGVAAVAITLAVLAAPRDSSGYAVGAGVAGGVALLFSYGTAAALLVGVAVMLALSERPWQMLGFVAFGLGVPLAVAASAGFWWPEGLLATGRAYWAGVASQRPAPYLTLVGNPAVLALATGPAVAVGLASFRRPFPRAAVLPLAALAAVVLVDVAQMSRGEIERIWLPFVPWLALAAPGDSRGWLAGQVGVALFLQSVLVSPW